MGQLYPTSVRSNSKRINNCLLDTATVRSSGTVASIISAKIKRQNLKQSKFKRKQREERPWKWSIEYYWAHIATHRHRTTWWAAVDKRHQENT